MKNHPAFLFNINESNLNQYVSFRPSIATKDAETRGKMNSVGVNAYFLYLGVDDNENMGIIMDDFW